MNIKSLRIKYRIKSIPPTDVWEMPAEVAWDYLLENSNLGIYSIAFPSSKFTKEQAEECLGKISSSTFTETTNYRYKGDHPPYFNFVDKNHCGLGGYSQRGGDHNVWLPNGVYVNFYPLDELPLYEEIAKKRKWEEEYNATY